MTCIMTSFFKRKPLPNYACDGSDLPATQDFGTVQYQGPSETALAVPATTVTYTIIGKTQCGDDIRRITTKTYSSRGPTLASGGGMYTYYTPLGILSGPVATKEEVYTGWYTSIPNSYLWAYWSICPTVNTGGFQIYYYGEPTYDTPAGNGNITIRDNTMQNNLSGYSIDCAAVAARLDTSIVNYTDGNTVTTAIYHDAYYIDINEVWTFDLV